MSRIATALLLVGCLIAADVRAQDAASVSAAQLHARMVFDGAPSPDLQVQREPGRARSVPLAAALSAIVPGTGQAYNRQWLKAAGNLAAEIAIGVGYLVNQRNGVEGRDAYQAYAHEHWNPTKYARWLNDYRSFLLENNPNRPIDAPEVRIPAGIDFSNPSGWSAADQRAVNEFFGDMRTLENWMYHHRTGATFAHRIPYFGEQQYYELIGKYFHFAVGWEDYEAARDENGNPTWREDGEYIAAIDPDTRDGSGDHVFVSDRFWDYRDDHATANDYFRRASRISSLFILNHIISAVDAAVFARLHNVRLESRMTLEYGPAGEAHPGVSFTYRF